MRCLREQQPLETVAQPLVEEIGGPSELMYEERIGRWARKRGIGIGGYFGRQTLAKWAVRQERIDVHTLALVASRLICALQFRGVRINR